MYTELPISSTEAEPCRDCGTTGGFRRRPGSRPFRVRGLCNACLRARQYRRQVLPPLQATEPVAPCVRCGTTGGYQPRDCKRPTRVRGLCYRCYDQARNSIGCDLGALLDRILSPQDLVIPAEPPGPEPDDPTLEEIAERCAAIRAERPLVWRAPERPTKVYHVAM